MLWGRRGGDGDPTEQEHRTEREEGTDRFPGAGRPGGQRGSWNPFPRYKSVLDLELTRWKDSGPDVPVRFFLQCGISVKLLSIS